MTRVDAVNCTSCGYAASNEPAAHCEQPDWHYEKPSENRQEVEHGRHYARSPMTFNMTMEQRANANVLAFAKGQSVSKYLADAVGPLIDARWKYHLEHRKKKEKA